jgi:excinuclease ABC subunit A
MMQKPDVDQIDGLSPAISIEQKTTSKNPRSTVGTVTEIYDYMRLLFARVGIPYSPATGLPIESQTVSQMVDRVMTLPEGTRLFLLAPMVRGRKGEYRKEMAELQKKGFQRVKVDGVFYEIDRRPGARQEVQARHRRRRRPHRRARRYWRAPGRFLRDGARSSPTASPSCRICRREGREGKNERIIFSEKFACPVSGFTIPEIEPRLFSFNNPFGACPTCDGLGRSAAHRPRSGVPTRTSR